MQVSNLSGGLICIVMLGHRELYRCVGQFVVDAGLDWKTSAGVSG